MQAALQRGASLLEITLVVAILGIIAAVMIPNLPSPTEHEIDLAATEVAEAVRFARNEAIRTGIPHGFRTTTSEQRIQIFWADTNTTPPTPVYDVYHPVEKTLYDVDLTSHPIVSTDSFSGNRSYRGTCDDPSFIAFDNNGTPYCGNPLNVILEQADLILTKGLSTRTITLHGITGRVTIN